jgi:hypothetical protein
LKRIFEFEAFQTKGLNKNSAPNENPISFEKPTQSAAGFMPDISILFRDYRIPV